MQLFHSSLTAPRQQWPCLHSLDRPLRLSCRISTKKSHVACARQRRASTGPQDEHVTPEEQPASPEAAVPLVRSSRRTAAPRNRRSSTLRSVSSPVNTLRDKGILAVDADGEPFVNVACLGEGQPHWYAVGLIENKEDTFMEQLSGRLMQMGYSVAPALYVPPIPPTAAQANAQVLAELEAAADRAQLAVEDAAALLEEVRGGPGETAAAGKLAEAEAAAAAAEKAIESMQASAEAGAVEAEAWQQQLREYDVVFWKPTKRMQVYSHNTDKMVERQVAFSRGTGGATLLLHCVMDPAIAAVVAATYYFQDWRFYMPVSAVLLNQHDLLPESADLEEVYKLPEPASESFLLRLSSWQHTRETEDEEAERREYYGTARGSPFGARPDKKAVKADDSNPNRWSVSAGPTNAGAAALIAAGQPLPWEQEPEQQLQGTYAAGRGGCGDRGRGARGDGRGRGGRGVGRQSQQQYGQQQYFGQQQYASQGFEGRQQQGFSGRGQGGRQGRGGYDSSGGRGMGRGGRGQQQWQQPWEQQYEQQQYAAGSGSEEEFGPAGAEDSFRERNRQRQMELMEELGGSRYRSSAADASFDQRGGSDDRWQQPPQQRWQQQQPQQQPGLGRDGGTTRMRQLDFTGDMGSDRYSDDEDRYDYDRLEGLDGTHGSSRQAVKFDGGWPDQQQQQQGRPRGGGRDGGAARNQQLGFMADMGSERYSDDEDDVMFDANDLPRGGSDSSSGNLSSFLSEVADAFEYMQSPGSLSPDEGSAPAFEGTAGNSSPTARNNAVGQGGRVNPAKVSYMDEDTMEWGKDDADFGAGFGQEAGQGLGGDSSGAAAAQAVLQAWQMEGQAGDAAAGFGPGQLKPYNAVPSTRSQEGLGASFEFDLDAGPGLASADSLLGQLPDPMGDHPQQTPQQQPAAEALPSAGAAAAAAAAAQVAAEAPAEPKRRSRASTSSRRSRKTEDPSAAADAAAAGRSKAANRKPARGTKKQQAAAAAGADEPPLQGFVGGADAADEGFEEGWVDRVMRDGNDVVGIDDVMRS